MKAAKNDSGQFFKPKKIIMKLKNQPTLIFDPLSSELEWTLKTQIDKNLQRKNKHHLNEKDNEKQLQKICEQMTKQVNSLNTQLDKKTRSNKELSSKLSAKQIELDGLKSKFMNLTIYEQQLQKVWKEYESKYL